jgi:hypothetical protein
MKSFIKFSIILLLNGIAFCSLNCFSANEPKKEEKLVCNKYCQSVNKILISHYNTTEIDLSSTQNIVRDIMDKKMKASGKADYEKSDFIPSSILSRYSKVAKDSKDVVKQKFTSNAYSVISLIVTFRQNDCDKGRLDVDIKLLSPDYTYLSVEKCNDKDTVSCVKKVLTDFADNIFGEFLFKEPVHLEL